MMDLASLDTDIFFLIVALLLAFGMYQTLGTGLGTDTPVVSVVSPSMEPTFYRGDLIVVKGTSIEDLEAGREDGDIIVFSSEYKGMPIIHRVIAKHNHTVETKGDANAGQVRYRLCDVRGRTAVLPAERSCDQVDGSFMRVVNIETNITQQQIKGEAFFIVPKLGYAKIIPTCLYLKLRLPAGHPAVTNICRGMFGGPQRNS